MVEFLSFQWTPSGGGPDGYQVTCGGADTLGGFTIPARAVSSYMWAISGDPLDQVLLMRSIDSEDNRDLTPGITMRALSVAVSRDAHLVLTGP